MKRFGLVMTLALCAGPAVCSAQTPAAPPAAAPAAPADTAANPALADFVVGNIRLEGLQRISEGTVYN